MITNRLRNIQILDLVGKLMIEYQSSCSIFILNLIKSQFRETISIHLCSRLCILILFFFRRAFLLLSSSGCLFRRPRSWCRRILKSRICCLFKVISNLRRLILVPWVILWRSVFLLLALLIRALIFLLPRKILFEINLFI